MKTLIAPFDGSESSGQALRCAQVLADRLVACDIVLLRADPDDAERFRADLEQLAAGVPGRSVRVECVTGDAVDAIVDAAQHEPDALVCMATHGRGRIAGPLLGSVATAVVRTLDAPVLLVGPHCDTDWWHDPPQLVTCWTGKKSNSLLPVAQAWSTEFGMDLSLVCVFHPLDVPASVDPDAQFALALERLEAGGEQREIRTVALHADLPAAAIADYASDLPASVLALTTHARQGVGRAVLGSVAQEILHRSPCPVLVVHAHPDDDD